MENKPKQTAVDYLFAKMEALRGLFLFEEIDYKEYVDQKKDALQKAKEMEKQQVIDAYNDGANERHNEPVNGEQYYKEEYAKDTNN